MNEKQNNNLEKAFQDYFSDFETNPSQNVWKNIDEELLDHGIKSTFDALEVSPSDNVWSNVISVVSIDQLFDHSFNSLEVTPSSENWDQISQTISFDQLFENTFQDFSQSPDSKVWDAISNHDFERQCRTKLKNYEVKPNDENWDIIKRAIPILIPLRAFIPQLTRVAAVFLLVFSFSLLINNSGWFKKSSNLPVAFSAPTIPVQQDDNSEKGIAVVPVKKLVESATTTTQQTPQLVNQVKPSNNTLSNNYVSTLVNNTQPSANSFTFSDFTKENTTKSTIGNQLAMTDKPSIKGFNKSSKVIQKLSGASDKVSLENDMDLTHLRSKQLEVATTSFASAGSSSMESIASSLKGEGNSSEFDEIKLASKLFSLTDNPEIVKRLNYTGLYVYFASQFNNTWIVNPEVQRQLSKFKTAKNMVDFGSSLGVGFGFRFSPRVAAEAGWQRATLNQKFREFVPGQLYLNNELKTVYNTYQVLGKYTFNRIKTSRRNPMTSSLAFGLHYRNLKSASMESETEFDPTVYINKEVGFTGGLDLDFYLNRSVTLNLGARASVGTDVRDLSTISLNSRFNNSYGLQAAVQYKISQ